MKAKPPYDEEIPPGDPEAVFCRWCHTGRIHSPTGRGLICVACDTNPANHAGSVGAP
jgi:hypothetical protein